MTKLKDVYPLYLANEAEQPNTDLEVTDKYTGKVAFRVAHGRRRRRSTPASPPRSRRPSRWRGWRPTSARPCSSIASTRFQRAVRRAGLCAVRRGGQADQGLPRARSRRLIDTFRIAAEEAVRMTGEVQPLDISPARARAIRASGSACRSGRAASSRRSTSRSTSPRTRSRPAIAVGCPFVMKPAQPHAARRDHHGRGAGRDRPAQGRLLDPARAPRRRRPVHRRTSG